MQHEAIISINWYFFTVLWMNNKHTHHANRQLNHLVRMGVVHMSSVLIKSKFVGVGFSRLDMRLRESTHSLHPRRQQDSVPMDAGGFRQFVSDEYAHPVALHGLNGGARCRAVIAPAFRDTSRREFMLYFFGYEVKLFHAVFHPVRECMSVQGYHRCVVCLPADLRGRFISCDFVTRRHVMLHIMCHLGPEFAKQPQTE